MANKEYNLQELKEEARLVWILDDEPEPDVHVFVKNGKAGVFITIPSGIMGLTSNVCVSIGEAFSYDEAFVLAFDPHNMCGIPTQSCIMALGQKGRTNIYAIEAYSAKPIIENAVSMEDALKQFGERIGLQCAPWMNLLTRPDPTWDKLDYTPENIQSLEPYQVFVFGSNLQGQHIGGAARLAHERFGAVWGQGEGLFGQSYALPTMGLSMDEIRKHVGVFFDCARQHPDLVFLVTKIGCGIAGFKEREIAPLFVEGRMGTRNVTLPKSFEEIIGCILRGEEY